MDEPYLSLIKRLADRLEHLSADSIYAHRASGLRGSILRYIGRIESGEKMTGTDLAKLDILMNDGFYILELAGKEIGPKK